MTTSRAIRDLRKLTGLTQKDFAKEIGLFQPHVSDLENGRRNITLTTLKKYSEKVGYSFKINFNILD